jgi:putative membrane protein
MGFWGVALRGYAMGAAELVPGVSGGTIAFISGLYSPLLASLAAFDGSFLQLLRRGDLRGAFVHVHGRFLLTLVLGMGLAILSLAALLKFLLATQAMLLWAFFFGLILASAVHVALSVGRWGALEGAAATLGVISGAWLTVLGGSFSFTDGPLALFFGGALAVCAWILPGVSGSFLLLVLGLYDRVLGAIAGIVIPDLLALAAGCGLGLLLFVRLLQRLLLTARKATLAALGGFMFGALQMLWPWQRIEAYQLGRDGAMRVLRSEPLGPNAYAQFYGEDPQLWAVAGLMCLGVAVVWGLARGQGYGDA